MGRMEILSRSLARDQDVVIRIELRMQETKRKIADWRKNRDRLDRQNTIRDVARNGWFLYACTFGHRSRFFNKQPTEINGNASAPCDVCRRKMQYLGRDFPIAKEVDEWKKLGYLPDNWRMRPT